MYARGMTVREIRGHLEELYGIDVSPDLISTITDAVLETVAEWPGRPLDACYPLVFFDAIRVKIRDEGFVRNKPVPSTVEGGSATALKEVCRATDADTAETALTAFEAGPWGTRYPAIGQSWRRAWAEVIPFFAFPDEVRRIISTTTAIEALNSKLRRAVRARGHLPSDEAATKALLSLPKGCST